MCVHVVPVCVCVCVCVSVCMCVYMCTCVSVCACVILSCTAVAIVMVVEIIILLFHSHMSFPHIPFHSWSTEWDGIFVEVSLLLSSYSISEHFHFQIILIFSLKVLSHGFRAHCLCNVMGSR